MKERWNASDAGTSVVGSGTATACRWAPLADSELDTADAGDDDSPRVLTAPSALGRLKRI